MNDSLIRSTNSETFQIRTFLYFTLAKLLMDILDKVYGCRQLPQWQELNLNMLLFKWLNCELSALGKILFGDNNEIVK